MNLGEKRIGTRILRSARDPLRSPVSRIPKPFLIEFITRSRDRQENIYTAARRYKGGSR